MGSGLRQPLGRRARPPQRKPAQLHPGENRNAAQTSRIRSSVRLTRRLPRRCCEMVTALCRFTGIGPSSDPPHPISPRTVRPGPSALAVLTATQLIRLAVANSVAGEVNRGDKRYLVIESARPDTRYAGTSTVPVPADGPGHEPFPHLSAQLVFGSQNRTIFPKH